MREIMEKESKKIRKERFFDDGDGLIIEYPNEDDKEKHESISFKNFYYKMVENDKEKDI